MGAVMIHQGKSLPPQGKLTTGAVPEPVGAGGGPGRRLPAWAFALRIAVMAARRRRAEKDDFGFIRGDNK